MMVAHAVKRAAPLLAGKQAAQHRIAGSGVVAGILSGAVNQLAHVVEQAAKGSPQGLRIQETTSRIGNSASLYRNRPKRQGFCVFCIHRCFHPTAGTNRNLRQSYHSSSYSTSFCPLAGMNCNNCTPSSPPARSSFRPLTGMNCNRGISRMCVSMFEFPSPRGDELQRHKERAADILDSVFPSPRGDELQRPLSSCPEQLFSVSVP